MSAIDDVRPVETTWTTGRIIEKELPLAASKVAIWNAGAKKADRVGVRLLADGKRVRFFKSSGEQFDA